MPTKQEILEAIRETAKKNGGKPLGYSAFKRMTGIDPYDWNKYWARFGDAQKEAGFTPNQLQTAHPDDFIFDKVIALIRKLGKFPTVREFILERHSDSEFPSKGTFNRRGTQAKLASEIVSYCKDKNGYEDVVEACQPILKEPARESDSSNDAEVDFGEVYLFKSGRYYKIGKTNDTVRRGTELRIQLPEKCVLVHSIKTDDPSGVEAYWHKRFEATRLNGEWFDLNSSDVKAFKRWRRVA